MKTLTRTARILSSPLLLGPWAVYYSRDDGAPGDTAGQDVEGFGDEWYLVAPDGTEVHDEEGAAEDPGPGS